MRFTIVSIKTLNDAKSSAPIIEIACVRVNQLEITDTFHQLLNPESPLSEEFTRQSGLYSADLIDQPVLEDMLPDMAAFIGRDIIIWTHSPQRTNAVYRHFRLTQPPERQLFLSALAEKTWPDRSAYSLVALAAELKLELTPRAESAALAGAQVFITAIQTLQQHYHIQSLSDLLAICPAPKVRQHRTRNDLAFDRNKLKNYPTQPGVYFMKNRLGEILYVGKAKNLRNRLRSYFQKQSRLPAKIAAMMKQVAMIDVTVVGSELEALLLEAQLIKQHLPFFNKKIKDYQRMIFMQLSAQEAYPRIHTAHETDDPSATYFGPFAGKSVLQYKLEILNRIFKLRDCTDRKFEEHRQSPCMQFHLGLCSGPCAGLITQQEYRNSVEDFIRYLEQQPSHAIEHLIAKRDAYTDVLQFEKAAAIQEQLDLLERLQLKNYELLRAIEEHHCFILLPAVQPDAVRLLTVLHGQPFQWHTVYPQQDDQATLSCIIDEALEAMAERNEQTNVRTNIAKSLYEEARLITHWLQTRTDDDGFVLYLKYKTHQQILNELQVLLMPGSEPISMHDTDALDMDTDTWEWEQALGN
jgi:DNA polymerase III epsilon subunit-like protein